MHETFTESANRRLSASPLMTGRRQIFTNETAITRGNVIDVLNKALEVHERNRTEEVFLEKYMRGIQPILSRIKNVNGEINNKIVVNIANQIVTFKTAEFAGEPIQYISRGGNPDTAEKVTAINSMMLSEGKQTKEPSDRAAYMDIAPLDKCENLRREITLSIEKMGLTPERSHHERGPGQNEIDFHYAKPLKAADQMTTFKMTVRTIAARYGLTADFSPMPLEGKPGNGYHINIYAVDKDGNDVVRYAAAGIIDKIRDITIFLNPTDASYARLGNNSAPDKVNWGSRGESELFFIETYKDKTKVELRSPDAGSNPYLVYALLINAGLYGIENKLELPEQNDEVGAFLPDSKKEAAKIARSSAFVKQYVPEEIIKEYTKL